MRTLLAAVVCTVLAVAATGCKSDDKMSSNTSSMSADKTMASMDVCSHCPGVQTATADGKCPGCGAAVKK